MSLLDSMSENMKTGDCRFNAFVFPMGLEEENTIEIAINGDGSFSIGQAIERESNGKTYYVISGPQKIHGHLVYTASCNEQAVAILGATYTVRRRHFPDEKRLENADGLCDDTTKEIVVETYEGDDGKPGVKTQLDVQQKKNLRHEIIHAFAFESGLAENSDWAQNEEMVDWFAIQGPKIYKTWQEVGAL